MTDARRRVPLTGLVILDGFGDGAPRPDNAVTRAKAPLFERLDERYPRARLRTSGECVGLPEGLMGNSEVGHMNLGAGRIVWQDITRIDRAIREGSFFENEALLAAVDHARSGPARSLHLVGLVSDGGVHSSLDHLHALLELAARRGLPGERVFVHVLTDGRDTPPRSGLGFVADLEKRLEDDGSGRIASVSGRYFAMDRDRRWDRVEKAYRCFVQGIGEQAPSGADAVRLGYERGETDEFLTPTVVGPPGEGRIGDGDAVVFFNFRADRARELSLALVDPAFDRFDLPRPRPRVLLATMTRYRADFPDLGIRDAFPPQRLDRVMADVVADAGLRQLRIAETEKYAHVTYFFSGGTEAERPGETRILVPSPKVATYDEQPEMSAPEVTRRLLAEIEAERVDFFVLNFANPDMVGHTGVLEAAVRAVATVGHCLSQVVDAVLAREGALLVTADHGNCEQMWDDERDCPHTAHTTNPVPVWLVGEALRGVRLREEGILAEVSPTLLEIMGLDRPPEMDARSLIETAPV